MAKYRKKPVVIEAVLWGGENYEEICKFMTGTLANPMGDGKLSIPTLEGDHTANPGDFIIKGVKGEFYPCKPDIFKETYELVE